MKRYLVKWLCILCVVVTIFSLMIGDPARYLAIASTTLNSTSVRGGGIGTITCPMGSSVDTNLSFVAISSPNGTLIGNWTFYSFDSTSPGNIVQGELYTGNVSVSDYELEGETVDQQDGIMLCDPPLFGPITISGTCGRDIGITIGFQTDDPFEEAESFSGSAECQRTNDLNNTAWVYFELWAFWLMSKAAMCGYNEHRGRELFISFRRQYNDMCFDYEFPEQRDNLKRPVKKEKSQGSEKAEEMPMIVSPVA